VLRFNEPRSIDVEAVAILADGFAEIPHEFGNAA